MIKIEVITKDMTAADGIAYSRMGSKQRGGGALAVVGLVVSAFSAIKQYDAQKDAAKAAKKQAAAARDAEAAKSRQSTVEAQRARIQQVREDRVKRAQILADTGNSGLGFSGTSGTVGGVSSVDSSTASNIGKINQNEGFAQEISQYNVAAGNAASDVYTAQAKGAQWQQIGSLGGSIFQAGGGFTTIFGGNTNKAVGAKTGAVPGAYNV